MIELDRRLMGKSRSVRFEDEIDLAVDRFMEKNDINFNKLVNLAVKEFISKPHTIELQPVDEAEWDKMMKKSYKKYKKTLDELTKWRSLHNLKLLPFMIF